MSLIKQLAGETAIYGVSSILGRLLNYVILTPYLTRVFNQVEYGTFTDLYSWVALLMVLFTYRMETTFFRFARKREDMDRTFSTASLSLFLTTVLWVSLLIGGSGQLAAWLKYPGQADYIVWLALILGFDTLSAIPFARLRLENRPIQFAALRVLNILVNLFFIFFFLELCPWLIDRGFHFLMGIYREDTRLSLVFLSNLLASASIFLLLLPSYARIRLIFDRDLWFQMIRYAAPLILAGLAGVINQLIGNPLLKELASPDLEYNKAQVGIYGAAAKIAVLMNLFTQAFNYAAEPFFFRNADRTDSRKIYGQIGQVFTLVACLFFLGIMLYIDLIEVLIGPEFREGIGVVPILLLAYLFLGLFYNFSIWYKLADRTNIGGYIALGGAAITILLNLLLIPRIGYYGPAWAALACYGFMALWSYRTGQKHHPIPYPLPRMTLYLLIALSGYFLNDLGRSLYGTSLLFVLFSNTLILAGCLYLFYRLESTWSRQLWESLLARLKKQ